MQATGVVKRVLAGFGFIGRVKDRDIFFHFTSCLGEKLPAVGDRVEFDIEPDPLKPDSRPHAVNVRPVSHD
jgi:cold shock CspA family protein